MSERRQIDIQVPVLTRVEGEGALELHIADGVLRDLKLRIYEPPRLFEKFLEGREPAQVLDMVARICGICPVAYQLTAVQAFEAALGFEPGPWLSAMRRVFYCGEWLQSHALHIHLLAAPDFLGFNDVTALAREHPQAVRRGLRLQALGNDLIRLFGGRSVHPVGVCVGGFQRAPEVDEVEGMRTRLAAAREDAEALLEWVTALPLPDDAQDFVCLALRHAEEYPMYSGRLVSSEGLEFDAEAFEHHVEERQLPYSTAFHALLHGRPYLVGPLARINLNHRQLPVALGERLERLGVVFPSRNMYHSIIARAAEIWLAVDEAERLLRDYRRPERPCTPLPPGPGTAVAASEAPRGVLWHRYRLDAEGRVETARIVPPTSQNQARIEADLRQALTTYGLEREDAELRQRGEMVIRNYDPCISCATHFLRLSVRRE
ncbi:Ni/Fe hydrogenase subunit alpha [Thiohalobacter sp. IOR34]|uniref:Ni/Fe hydrogenase subunit alpha n=1 Tax=Thiohalobacter sp. IOR34 TaxID=3057176 RepID=UPI0025B0E3FF|nr:Ni/Fe hydrogenase subunit alpha [Thiohalobacter sp. IOR34]WJW74420.1 Ni/Fe hydrogenase subunit alpha [Thiohalobacter sp. IOR34]